MSFSTFTPGQQRQVCSIQSPIHLILGKYQSTLMSLAEAKKRQPPPHLSLPPSPQVRERPQRASRVLLDIEAGAPVLLIPESSRSPRLIVANLGQLRVHNSFLPAGTHGTFSLRDKVEKLTMAHTFFPSLVSPDSVSTGRPHPCYWTNMVVFMKHFTLLHVFI